MDPDRALGEPSGDATRTMLPSVISDKCGVTGGGQSLRDPQVSMDDEEHLMVDSIKAAERLKIRRIRSRIIPSRVPLFSLT